MKNMKMTLNITMEKGCYNTLAIYNSLNYQSTNSTIYLVNVAIHVMKRNMYKHSYYQSINLYICMCMCVCVCVCIYIYVCVCVAIYIYTYAFVLQAGVTKWWVGGRNHLVNVIPY